MQVRGRCEGVDMWRCFCGTAVASTTGTVLQTNWLAYNKKIQQRHEPQPLEAKTRHPPAFQVVFKFRQPLMTRQRVSTRKRPQHIHKPLRVEFRQGRPKPLKVGAGPGFCGGVSQADCSN